MVKKKLSFHVWESKEENNGVWVPVAPLRACSSDVISSLTSSPSTNPQEWYRLVNNPVSLGRH